MSDNTPDGPRRPVEEPDDDRVGAPIDTSKPRTLCGRRLVRPASTTGSSGSAPCMIVFVMAMVLFPGLIADEEKTSSLTGGCDLSNSLLPAELGVLVRHRPAGLRRLLAERLRRPAQRHGRRDRRRGDHAHRCGRRPHRRLLRWADRLGDLPDHRHLLRPAAASWSASPSCRRSACRASGASSLVLCLLGWVVAARMVRAQTIEAKGQDYTTAARALGASNSRIMMRHILPNAIGPSIVLAVIALGGFIAAEATFSFLGLGIRPPAVLLGHDDRRRPGRLLRRRRGPCCSRRRS